MLAIRLKRIGRRSQAAYRMVVQDSHWSPKSGKVVAFLGSYDPHTKTLNLNKEKTAEFVKNGAQPSPKVAQLLRKDGQKLPKWVAKPAKKSGKARNPDKKAKVSTPTATSDEPASEPAAEAPSEQLVADEPKEASAEQPKPDEAAAEPATEAPANQTEPEPK